MAEELLLLETGESLRDCVISPALLKGASSSCTGGGGWWRADWVKAAEGGGRGRDSLSTDAVGE